MRDSDLEPLKVLERSRCPLLSPEKPRPWSLVCVTDRRTTVAELQLLSSWLAGLGHLAALLRRFPVPMASVDEANKVTQFCELCGSDRETAEHVLDAHSWDLDRSIGFFMDHGGTLPSGVQQHVPEAMPDLVEDPIRTTDSPPARPAAPPPQPVSMPQYHTTVVEEEEDPDFDPEYERALAASRLDAGTATSHTTRLCVQQQEHCNTLQNQLKVDCYVHRCLTPEKAASLAGWSKPCCQRCLTAILCCAGQK